MVKIADLTTAAVFSYSLQGNRRVYTATLTSANTSTSDTVSFPCSAITSIISASWSSTSWDEIASTAMVGPVLSIGSSANAVRIARSSVAVALPMRMTIEGR